MKLRQDGISAAAKDTYPRHPTGCAASSFRAARRSVGAVRNPIMAAEDIGPEEPIDDVIRAHHEAGHCVVLWRLGYGVKRVTIEPSDGVLALTEARETADTSHPHPHVRRFFVEQAALYLHAGSVAARLLRPEVSLAHAKGDHDAIHQLMFGVEDDGAAHAAWCMHLWQRAYTLLAWPSQWYLVVGLARQLLNYRMLNGEEVERYLQVADNLLQYDPRMPNAKLIGELTHVCSPWHRRWYEQSAATPLRPKRADVPTSIASLSAKADMRPLALVLEPLSGRARNLLERSGIRTVGDLEEWNARSLSALRGAGEKTVREIVAAAGRVGVRLAPPNSDPTRLNPRRWGTV
jgi:hypothetical protein